MNFCIEIELTDAENKCHQYVTVACVGEKFVHVQGGKLANNSCGVQYEGLDARPGDTELHLFRDFFGSLHHSYTRLDVQNKKLCLDNTKGLDIIGFASMGHDVRHNM